jgi:hypothetical protein
LADVIRQGGPRRSAKLPATGNLANFQLLELWQTPCSCTLAVTIKLRANTALRVLPSRHWTISRKPALAIGATFQPDRLAVAPAGYFVWRDAVTVTKPRFSSGASRFRYRYRLPQRNRRSACVRFLGLPRNGEGIGQDVRDDDSVAPVAPGGQGLADVISNRADAGRLAGLRLAVAVVVGRGVALDALPGGPLVGQIRSYCGFGERHVVVRRP